MLTRGGQVQKLSGPTCTPVPIPGKCVPGEEGAPIGAGLKCGDCPPPTQAAGFPPPPHDTPSSAPASGKGKMGVEMEDEPAPEVAEGMGEGRALARDSQNASFPLSFPLFSSLWREGEGEGEAPLGRKGPPPGLLGDVCRSGIRLSYCKSRSPTFRHRLCCCRSPSGLYMQRDIK